jgi:hypothetical protein
VAIMFNIDGTSFEEYKVKSIEMDLDTCKITFKVIFHADKMKKIRIKEYSFDTSCDVNVNIYMEELNKLINGTNIHS